MASYPATASNGACFAKCAALSGCRVSVRDPSNGNCFLKGTDPNSLLVSKSLATTYCAGTPLSLLPARWSQGMRSVLCKRAPVAASLRLFARPATASAYATVAASVSCEHAGCQPSWLGAVGPPSHHAPCTGASVRQPGLYWLLLALKSGSCPCHVPSTSMLLLSAASYGLHPAHAASPLQAIALRLSGRRHRGGHGLLGVVRVPLVPKLHRLMRL